MIESANQMEDGSRETDKQPNRILMVDDEPDLELLVRQRFRRRIRSSDYEFLFAGNGQKAL